MALKAIHKQMCMVGCRETETILRLVVTVVSY
jgi:hypothetical protein